MDPSTSAYNRLDMGFLLQMGELKNTLVLAFGKHKSLDSLYSEMNMNLFNKEHLKKMQKNEPKKLIMALQSREIVGLMSTEDTSHARTLKRHNDFNLMFQGHTEKQKYMSIV